MADCKAFCHVCNAERNHLTLPDKRGCCTICGNEKHLTNKEIKNVPDSDWAALDRAIEARKRQEEAMKKTEATSTKRKHGRVSKFNDQDKEKIRARRSAGEKLKDIAPDYKVDISTISVICKGIKPAKTEKPAKVKPVAKGKTKGKSAGVDLAALTGAKPESQKARKPESQKARKPESNIIPGQLCRRRL